MLWKYTSQPAAEPVTYAQAKLQCYLDDDTLQTLITSYITAARLHGESVTGRTWVQRNVQAQYYESRQRYNLPRGPVQSITSVVDGTGATVNPSTYQLRRIGNTDYVFFTASARASATTAASRLPTSPATEITPPSRPTSALPSCSTSPSFTSTVKPARPRPRQTSSAGSTPSTNSTARRSSADEAHARRQFSHSPCAGAAYRLAQCNGRERAVVAQEVAIVWAKVKTLAGTNLALQQANTVTSIATHQITIRYNPAYLGQVTWRCRIGGTMGFDTLDDDEFAVMTSNDFAALVSDSGPPPRYFTIKGLMNTDEWNRELSWLATEVQG